MENPEPSLMDECLPDRVRRPAFARMLKIHDLIAAGGYPNCASLSADLEVSDKTVQRDVEFMRDRMGLPIEYDAGRRGFHYTREVASFPRISMTEGEVVALLIAQKALVQYRGTPFEKPLRGAFRKMAESFGDETVFSLDDLGKAVSFHPVGNAIQEMRVFEMLAGAVANSRVVEFDYHKLGSQAPERRCVEPYHLGCIDNAWYLIGHDLVRGKRRTYALSRLTNPSVLKRHFKRPDDFSLEEMFGGSFSAFETGKVSRVVIRLDPFAARLAAERVWHRSQRLKPLPGGGAELTLEVGLAPDLENWILGWGNHALVLEPRELCERIAATARSMALQYSV